MRIAFIIEHLDPNRGGMERSAVPHPPLTPPASGRGTCHPNSRTSVSLPVTAAAAAIAGLTR